MHAAESLTANVNRNVGLSTPEILRTNNQNPFQYLNPPANITPLKYSPSIIHAYRITPVPTKKYQKRSKNRLSSQIQRKPLNLIRDEHLVSRDSLISQKPIALSRPQTAETKLCSKFLYSCFTAKTSHRV